MYWKVGPDGTALCFRKGWGHFMDFKKIMCSNVKFLQHLLIHTVKGFFKGLLDNNGYFLLKKNKKKKQVLLGTHSDRKCFVVEFHQGDNQRTSLACSV